MTQPVPATRPVIVEATASDVTVVEDFGERWDPTSTQTVEDRLSTIVAESMGEVPPLSRRALTVVR